LVLSESDPILESPAVLQPSDATAEAGAVETTEEEVADDATLTATDASDKVLSLIFIVCFFFLYDDLWIEYHQ